MKRSVFVVATTLAITGCAPTNITPPPPRAGDPPLQSRPAPLPAAPPPKAEPPDTCGAKDLQYLVGRPKTEIPVPVKPGNRRVTCSTCPVTMDYRPDRANIYFDQATGIVQAVKCG